jgi:hypothetical protein
MREWATGLSRGRVSPELELASQVAAVQDTAHPTGVMPCPGIVA